MTYTIKASNKAGYGGKYESAEYKAITARAYELTHPEPKPTRFYTLEECHKIKQQQHEEKYSYSFKVGQCYHYETFASRDAYHYKVVKRTKCFVYVQHQTHYYNNVPKVERRKVYKTEDGDEYFKIVHGSFPFECFSYDGSKDEDVPELKKMVSGCPLKAQAYRTLGFTCRPAYKADIKKAYHKLALQHHPDKGGDDEIFKKIQQAWETLNE